MTISYRDIKPWGRSYGEYIRMFGLTPADLELRILGCGDGPASFNAGLTERDGNVTSIDPIYAFKAEEIRQRIDDCYEEILGQTRDNRDEFVWREIGSVEELGRVRMASMAAFLKDYPGGLLQKRYVPGELPSLPFKDREFDLALSSHLLFFYADNLSQEFHLRSLEELLRVAKEVRIFPVVDLNGDRSRHLGPVIGALRAEGRAVAEVKVDYEFQKGGNTMLRVR